MVHPGHFWAWVPIMGLGFPRLVSFSLSKDTIGTLQCDFGHASQDCINLKLQPAGYKIGPGCAFQNCYLITFWYSNYNL